LFGIASKAIQTLCCAEDVCREENLDLINSELRRANGDHDDRLASFQMLPSATVNLTQINTVNATINSENCHTI